MEVSPKEFGEFRGETRAEIRALHEKVDTQGRNLDTKITQVGTDQAGGFRSISNRLDLLEQRNGWRGGIRTAGWGGGGATLLFGVLQFIKSMF